MKIEYLLTDKSMKVPPNYIKVGIKKNWLFYFGLMTTTLKVQGYLSPNYDNS